MANNVTANLTTPNTNGSSTINFTPGSFVSFEITEGTNSVGLDVSGTWGGGSPITLYFAATTQAGFSPVPRAVPGVNITSFSTGGQGSIASGSQGYFTTCVGGGGTIYAVLPPAFTGAVQITMGGGPGSAPDGPGDVISIRSTVSTDGSGSITTGGTAQTLFGGTVPLNGYEIINTDASNVLWVNDSGGTASAGGPACYELFYLSGGYSTPTGMAPSGAISIVGAVTGQKFVARFW